MIVHNVVDVHGKHDCCNNSLQALRKQCQNFATALLDHTRSSGELGEIQWNIDSIFFAGYIYPLWYMQYTYYVLQTDVSFCRNFAQPRPSRTYIPGLTFLKFSDIRFLFGWSDIRDIWPSKADQPFCFQSRADPIAIQTMRFKRNKKISLNLQHGERMHLNRLKLAIKYGQKKVSGW